MPSPGRRLFAGATALLTAIWASVIWGVANRYPCNHNFPHDVDSPVLALEVSGNETDIEAVLHRQKVCEKFAQKQSVGQENTPTQNQRLANRLDLVFIPLYLLSVWSFGRLFAPQIGWLTACIISTGLFDYIEDWEISKALNGSHPLIFIPSVIKWSLLGVTFVQVAILLFRSEGELYSLPTKRIMGIGYLLAGLLLLVDVVWGWIIGYSLIALANGIFGLLLLSNSIGLLGPYVLRPVKRHEYVDDFCEKLRTQQGDQLRRPESNAGDLESKF